MCLILASLAASPGCGADDVPDASELPLAPGLEVAGDDVRRSDVDESEYRAIALTSSYEATARAMNRAEITYLREAGWKVRRHKNGTANAVNGTVWAYVGFKKRSCRDLNDSLQVQPGTPYICASLGG
jgi:hypothetical protein